MTNSSEKTKTAHNILIVEDDVFLLEILSAKFQKSGYSVNIAANGEDCMEVLGSNKPDIVLLDIVMPKMDGYEVLRRMKSSKDLSDIPIVMISNLGRLEDVQKAKDLGAIDYIIKSNFTVKEIVDKVNKVLNAQ